MPKNKPPAAKVLRHRRESHAHVIQPSPLRDDFAEHVERMTNNQRNRWAKAGYPGKRERNVEKLWEFVPPPLGTAVQENRIPVA